MKRTISAPEGKSGQALPAHPASDRKTPPSVTAVGASAGGLDALFSLLSGIPKNSGMAFVVLLHLERDGKSALPELLGSRTTLTVLWARNGAEIHANHVFVGRPGTEVTVSGGKLRVAAVTRPADGWRNPIDRLMKSLATDRGSSAIGIVLSGTGSDGTEGLKALKEAGGLTLVQDPSEAEYDGMPRQAIASAQPDHILRAAEMPEILMRYIAHDYVSTAGPAKPEGAVIEPDEWLQPIIAKIHSQTGIDFSLYKPGMIQRRIDRRMAFHGIEDHAGYSRMLLKSPQETVALARDLTINVTAFFRDPEAFDALASHLGKLIERRPADQPFRAWIVGCSTGEEAYSIAILLFERMEAAGKRPNLKIFASDIDEDALAVGRGGLYPATIADTVSADRLNRFFTREDGKFRAVKELREAVIFSRHDILRDPPISNLDLVTCRNLSIYLVPQAQRRLMERLIFALREQGLLFLGRSEEINVPADMAGVLDAKQRIYRRTQRNQNRRSRASLIAHHPVSEAPPREAGFGLLNRWSFFDDAEAVIQQNRATAAAVITRQLLPVYFFGEIERYLHVPAGPSYPDLPVRIHTMSRRILRDTITKALGADGPVEAEIDVMTAADQPIQVTIEARRLPQKDRDLVLVSFIERVEAVARHEDMPANHAGASALKAELAEARRQLDRTILELRDANNELRRKNEELLSLNEEFLSTNEELHASKDELNTLNEELTTANEQLRNALSRQAQTATDLINLLDSSPVAIILLDKMLRIKVFNPRMRDLFALIDTDIGRPLADLLPKFADPTLIEDTNAARSAGKPSVREIQGEGGAWYIRSVQPDRTKAGDIQGAVVTFADVTAVKQAELASASARHYAQTIVNTAREPLVVIDSELRVEATNPAFCAAMDIPAERASGRKLRDLGRPLLAHPSLIELSRRVLDGQDTAGTVEIETGSGQTGEQRIWKAHVRSFQRTLSDGGRILIALEDITEQRRIVRHQLQLLIDALPQPIIAVDDQRTMRFVSNHMKEMFGYKQAELVGQKIDMLLPAELRKKHSALFKGFGENPSVRAMGSGLDVHGVTKDGARIPLDVGLSPVMTAEGPLIVAALHDLRALREGEDRHRAAKAEADRANQAKTRFLAAASHDLRQPLQTIGLLTGVLEKRAADPETRATLLRLDDAVAHMTGLVDTLLDINHIESGGVKVEMTELAVGPLMSRVADDYEPLALAKNLNLRLVHSSAAVSSDRRLLTRIIGNLVSNAVKYTDKGKILVGCRRRQGTLRIEIWDSGIGIPPQSIEAVFDEFYRIDRADSSRFGLGLGLYIVKRFAELLGHRIEVHSTPGKGTMFAVVIANPSFNATEIGAGTAHRWQPTALLVEDDQSQLDALRALLEFEGYRVIAAQRGDEAMEKLHQDRSLQPSVIIADYRLPGKLSGLDVIRLVRGSVGAATPAVLISGDRPAVALDTSEFADFLFVAKPVKAASLVSTVNTLISRSMPDWRPSKLATAATDLPRLQTASKAAVAIIDDEPGVRDAARAVLGADGYDVSTFASGEAFFADPNHSRFGCVVADISLPGIDGLELQRKLRTEGNGGIPVIFMTGNSDLAIAVLAMREGAADFLQKPVDGGTIQESVARALESTAATAPLPASDRAEVEARIATLTERERQVLEQMVAGTLTKNIASALGISQRTTEHHRQSVMRKMRVKSLAMLVRMVGGLLAVTNAQDEAGQTPPAPPSRVD